MYGVSSIAKYWCHFECFYELKNYIEMPLYLQTAVFITQGELQKARDGGGNGGSIAVL